MLKTTYNFVSDDVNELYLALVRELVDHGQEVYGTKELCNVKFTLTNPKNSIVRIPERKTSKKYLLAENIWYAAGHNEVSFIGQFASLWNRLSDDGVTNNSAYGYIMKYKHGFNQIEKIIEMLSKNPDNRRAIININVPNEDIIETHDEQCTIFLQFLIRDNKLNMTACMRSNDIINGLTNDIVAFTGLQQYIAYRLGIEVGDYTHFDSSLHYYHNERDDAKINAIYNSNLDNLTPEYSIDWIKLYEEADKIYDLVDSDKENIIKICRENKILID